MKLEDGQCQCRFLIGLGFHSKLNIFQKVKHLSGSSSESVHLSKSNLLKTSTNAWPTRKKIAKIRLPNPWAPYFLPRGGYFVQHGEVLRLHAFLGTAIKIGTPRDLDVSGSHESNDESELLRIVF